MIALAKHQALYATLWDEFLPQTHLYIVPDVQVKYGDVWQLGKHRIACLDALEGTTYDHLLTGCVKLHALIADPPYGMRLDTDYSSMKGGGDFVKRKNVTGGRKYAAIEGDHEDFDASFFVSHFADVQEQFWFGANYYATTLGDTMHRGSWLVWDKRELEALDRMFGSGFELIWSRQKHKQDILRHRWAGVFGTEHEPGTSKREHPTQKPVRLIEDLITRYTSEGSRILDPFLGSGSTIIAAERTKRIVYGCELSPHYCDVIISRWEQATGQKAVRL